MANPAINNPAVNIVSAGRRRRYGIAAVLKSGWNASDKGAESVGAELRLARLKSDRSLEEVASRTRIKEAHLRAIEDMNVEALPGRAYALGFVRSYANFLGMDAQAVLERFKAETGLDKAGRPQKYEFFDDDDGVAVKRGGPPIIVILIVLFAGIWVFWRILRPSPEAGAELAQRAFLEAIFDRDAAMQTSETELGESTSAAENVRESASVLEKLLAESSAPTAQEGVPASSVVDADSGEDAGRDVEAGAAHVTAGLADDIPESASPEESATELLSTTTADAPAVTGSQPEAAINDEAAASFDAAAAGDAETAAQEPDIPESAPERSDRDIAEAASAASEPPIDAALSAAQEEADPGGAAEGDDEGDDTEAPSDAADLPTVEAAALAPEDAAPVAERASGSRVALRALIPSYLKVARIDGETLIDRRLEAGELFLAPQEEGWLLTVLNAGGFQVIVDGENIGLLGGAGEFLTELPLEADEIRAAAERRR
ncbi:MAG: helix-turn-helix domain-containing protein [Parvularculaceae bacterium]